MNRSLSILNIEEFGLTLLNNIQHVYHGLTLFQVSLLTRCVIE